MLLVCLRTAPRQLVEQHCNNSQASQFVSRSCQADRGAILSIRLSFLGALLQNVSRLPGDDRGRSLLAGITTTRQPAEESTDIVPVDEAAARAARCPIDVARAVAKAVDDPVRAAMAEADEVVVLVARGVAARRVKEASVPLVMVVSRRPRRSLTQRWRTTSMVAVVLSQAGRAATT